jgi:hypothetical protein
MLARCMQHQGEHPVALPPPAEETRAPVEAHACVPYAPTSEAPNLLVWTGDRHALALELKEADAVPDAVAFRAAA